MGKYFHTAMSYFTRNRPELFVKDKKKARRFYIGWGTIGSLAVATYFFGGAAWNLVFGNDNGNGKNQPKPKSVLEVKVEDMKNNRLAFVDPKADQDTAAAAFINVGKNDQFIYHDLNIGKDSSEVYTSWKLDGGETEVVILYEHNKPTSMKFSYKNQNGDSRSGKINFSEKKLTLSEATTLQELLNSMYTFKEEVGPNNGKLRDRVEDMIEQYENAFSNRLALTQEPQSDGSWTDPARVQRAKDRLGKINDWVQSLVYHQ